MKELKQLEVHGVTRQVEEYSRGIEFIKKGSVAGLKGLQANYLYNLVSANSVATHVPTKGSKKVTKQIMADTLVEWVHS